MRGYAYRSIGVETFEIPGEDPFVIGGKGLFEASGELRYRINESFGRRRLRRLGLRHRELRASRGESDLRTGVGLGVRYYTGIGILRADLATPVDPRAGRLARRALHRHRTGVLKRLLAALGVLVLVAIAAVAQDVDRAAATTASCINLLENRLSTPEPPDPAERRHRRAVVAGADRRRSPSPTPKGAWLEIDNAELDWSRLALLRGRVDVNRLQRRAHRPGCAAPSRSRRRRATLPTRRGAALLAAGAAGVDPASRELALDRASRFDEPVFGQAAELSAHRARSSSPAARSTPTLDVTPARRARAAS